jgi:hypothetical protein
MNARLNELIARIHVLEEEVEQELRRRRAELQADFEDRRVRFEQDLLAQQRRFRLGLWGYLRESELRNVITAPVIYLVVVPFIALDLAVGLYQYLCFPLYGIPLVRRRDYLVFDRANLAYLNVIEKFNCAYCSYASGLVAYVREVVGRTEQYWCPIKHSRRVLQAHPYYHGFVDFGDAQAYREQIRELREKLAALGDESGIPKPD